MEFGTFLKELGEAAFSLIIQQTPKQIAKAKRQLEVDFRSIPDSVQSITTMGNGRQLRYTSADPEELKTHIRHQRNPATIDGEQ